MKKPKITITITVTDGEQTSEIKTNVDSQRDIHAFEVIGIMEHVKYDILNSQKPTT